MLKRKLQEKWENPGDESAHIKAFIEAYDLHHYKSISSVWSELGQLVRPSPTQDRSPVVVFTASRDRKLRLLLGVFMHAHIDAGMAPQKDPLLLSDLVKEVSIFSERVEDGLVPVIPTARHHFKPAAAYFATGHTLLSLPAKTRKKLLTKNPGIA